MDGRESSGDIEQAASQWVAQMDRGPLLPAEQERLESWLAGDRRRRGALVRAQALWAKAAALHGSGGLQPAGHCVTATGHVARGHQRVLQWASAAMASLLLGALLFVTIPGSTAYATSKGEIRMVPLRGGSTITLNTDSRVNVRDRRGRMRVELQKGEVFVQTAGKRLQVEVAGRRIDAGAASFVVRKLDGQPVQVVVQNGEVRLPGADAPATLVTANTRMSMVDAGSTPAVAQVSPDELQRELAWREGQIAFHGESLAEAVQMFARYSDTRIVVEDPALAEMPVTGLFAANDPVGFADAVAQVLEARLRHEPGRVLLASRY